MGTLVPAMTVIVRHILVDGTLKTIICHLVTDDGGIRLKTNDLVLRISKHIVKHGLCYYTLDMASIAIPNVVNLVSGHRCHFLSLSIYNYTLHHGSVIVKTRKHILDNVRITLKSKQAQILFSYLRWNLFLF